MKIVSTKQIRELDQVAIEKCGIPGALLMERAGRGVAAGIARLFKEYGLAGKKVLLIAGHGNNGGDAFVAARVLKERGFDSQVLLAGEKEKIKGDALAHFEKTAQSGITAKEIRIENEWNQIADEAASKQSFPLVIVDGILGTGLAGPARGTAAAAIRFINSLSGKSMVAAIDVPSGLNSDTGAAEGEVVCADLTITMGLPKRGLVAPRALEQVGSLEVVDIGFPPAIVEKIDSGLELITPSDLCPLFPRRRRDSHKGAYGHLLIIGGSSGYSGAITLTAMAALRSGAGLVTVVVPQNIAPIVAANVPEAMVHGAPRTKSGSLGAACWKEWKKRLGEFSSIVAGPGMTRHMETRRLVEMILRDSKAPVVLDADALNVFEGKASALKRKCPLVITPHPGEMARLLGIRTDQVQADRFAAALKASALTNSTTVLKGAGTLVAEGNRPLQINLTGNPGMAAGGMGDALAGLLGGMLAQGMENYDAARAAVWLHGRAGDLAAASKTQRALITRDLIAFLPRAYREITGR